MPRESQNDQFQVERIIDKRFVKGSPEYKVKWKGYSEQQCTWEKVRNLKTVVDLIMDYQNSKFYVKTQYKDQKRKETCKILSQKQRRALNIEPTYIDINGNTKTVQQMKANMIVEQEDSDEDKSTLDNNKAEEDQKTQGEESNNNNLDEPQVNELIKIGEQAASTSNPSLTNNASVDLSLQIGQIRKKFSKITRKISGISNQGPNVRFNKISKKALKASKQERKEESNKVLKKRDDITLQNKNNTDIKINPNNNIKYSDKSCCIPNIDPTNTISEKGNYLNSQKTKYKHRKTQIFQNQQSDVTPQFRQIPIHISPKIQNSMEFYLNRMQHKQTFNKFPQSPSNQTKIPDFQQVNIASLPKKNYDAKNSKVDVTTILEIKQENKEQPLKNVQIEKDHSTDAVIRIRQLEYTMTKATQYAVQYESGNIKIHNTLNLILLHPLDFVKYLDAKTKISKI